MAPECCRYWQIRSSKSRQRLQHWRQLLAWQKSHQPAAGQHSGDWADIATAIATTVADPNVFRSGPEFAAWLGLVPRQNSTGGKPRLGGITERGNRYLRRLLINGEIGRASCRERV